MATIDVRGAEFAVDDLATAPGAALPFVWGHGLTSSRAGEDEFPLVDGRRLAAQRRVVRYDARGHGETGDLASPDEGAWSELALDQVALIDALDIADVVIGGASMGAATALHAAPLLGDRLRALVLVIPPTAWETRAEQADLYETMAAIVEAKGVEPLIAAAAAMPPPDPFIEVVEQYRARRAESMRAADPRRLAAVFRGASGADFPSEEAVAAIDVPTLILAWPGDPGHPVSTAERLEGLMPNTEVAIASTFDEFVGWTDRVEAFLAHVDRLA